MDESTGPTPTPHVQNVTVNGLLSSGGTTTIHGSVTATAHGPLSVPEPSPGTNLTPAQRKLVQDVVDAVVAADLWRDRAVQQALREVAAADDEGRAEPTTVRRWLAEVESHAGSAAAVLTAVQLAQASLGG